MNRSLGRALHHYQMLAAGDRIVVGVSGGELLQPGADADLTIVDINREQTVSAGLYPSACDYTPYEGWKLKGWPILTMVRGKTVMENGIVAKASEWGRVVGLD